MDFTIFKKAVANRFAAMTKDKGKLFSTSVSGDDLWEMYLASYPEGTNPIYRNRTEHDCSCCKQFVRNIGGVVSVKDGIVSSIWDVDMPSEPAFQAVADALSNMVKASPVANKFLHTEKTIGTDKSFEKLLEGGQQSWNHFFVNLPSTSVVPGATLGTVLGDTRSTYDVMRRGLTEITDQAVDTVLELIAQNSLYRGEEHKFAVSEFKKLKSAMAKAPNKDLFLWENLEGPTASVARIRNTSIGTLLVDLSEGVDIEKAVKSFEAKVAPANYKRPTAAVTKSMIVSAKATVEELGLTSALERRYAQLEDITANNVLFADRSVKKSLSGSVFDDLTATSPTTTPNLSKIEEVSIEKFLVDILPKVESVEVMLENRHEANLVSLIAPLDPTSQELFKWASKFSWSYKGEVADSDIRAQVQARGGRVDGVFRFSHSWNYDKRNASLMDLHVFMPGSLVSADSGINDYYGDITRNHVGWNNREDPVTKGVQDVDYVTAAPEGYVPVENITFPDLKRMREGMYICKVHNWQLRAPTQGGFKAEIEVCGEVFQYEVTRPLKHKEWVTVAEVTLKGGVFSIKHHLPVGSATRAVWGLQTQQFHKASVILLSPNHWDDQVVGNKHYFFMLDGCVNDGKARGFYNEFLKSNLDKHRKVLELVGSRTTVKDSPHQLSGIGFSSTQRNSILCKVRGSFTRTINVTF